MTEQPIRLARHFEVFIEDQVAQRKYGSPTEVIEEALRLLEAREAGQATLRRALLRGEESGEATPFDMAGWLDEQEGMNSAA
jgi:antitoxin ParD1/3/4